MALSRAHTMAKAKQSYTFLHPPLSQRTKMEEIFLFIWVVTHTSSKCGANKFRTLLLTNKQTWGVNIMFLVEWAVL